jgi:hypothetical protein
MENDLPEHARRNRAAWDRWTADDAQWAPRAWAQAEPTRGILKVSEAAVRLLPDEVAGLDVVGLGCGTAGGAGRLRGGGATARSDRKGDDAWPGRAGGVGGGSARESKKEVGGIAHAAPWQERVEAA